MNAPTLKTILVPDVDEARTAPVLCAAQRIAEAMGARSAVMVALDVPPPMPSDWGAMAVEMYAHLYQEARTRAEERAEALKARTRDADPPVEVRLVEARVLYPGRTVAMHAHYADLVALPTPGDGDALAVRGWFHDVLFGGGAPVLVVPDQVEVWLPPRRAVVAWTPTREAARAVRDALPLLRGAQVDLVVVDAHVGERAHGEEPGADIAAHLARHGVNVNVVQLGSGNADVADTLLGHARASGADLLVAGAYGHTRLREFVLGGTTRCLFDRTHIPILFSR